VKREPRFLAYKAKDGWRWHLSAANGCVLADSGEAYSSRSACLRAIATVQATVEHIGHKAMIERIRKG
jgi:uncharacterized protein YegP (UPF0339 family)